MDRGREKNHRGIEEIIEKTFRFSRNARQVMEKKKKKNLHIDYGDTIFFGRFPSESRVPAACTGNGLSLPWCNVVSAEC